ncbi:hypothetical protein [Parvularcula dongshanensis]|uniref:Uncharacterized protein n=1 Tax=Parvularcula dongshanensis TaxID=1173995 RepID=A0A840I669_9PROT|nr:hypothetical protein [Parvularcula dongshanensis]MBB4659510.1 hypothetical protein [Parvularcula dongshanensis]
MDAGVRSLAIGYPEAGGGIVILSNSDKAVPSWGLILEEEFGDAGAEIVRRNR